jgi:hypothetical protein
MGMDTAGSAEDVQLVAAFADLLATDADVATTEAHRLATRLVSVLGAGAVKVALERARQLRDEGFTPEGDSAYTTELARASQSYVAAALYSQATGAKLALPPDSWPFPPDTFKPTAGPARNLEKAAALLAAELDRLAYAPDSD